MSRYRPIRKLRLGAAALATFTLSGEAWAVDRFNIADRFNSAIEVVQEGIDLLWPDDLKKDITARFGVGLGWVPDYVGSNNYRFRAMPLIDLRYKNDLRLNGGQLTYAVYHKGSFEAGPLLNLHSGRSESSNPALEGMGDIPTTLDVGIFARYSNNSMLISGDIRKALGAEQGMSMQITAGHGIYQNGDFALGAGVRAKWLSRSAMQTNFGVTEEQASRSSAGLTPFEAHAGVSEISVNMLGVLRINDSTRLMTLVSAGHLLGSASNSPISGGARGGSVQLLGGTALQFTF